MGRRQFDIIHDDKGRFVMPGYLTTDMLSSYDAVNLNPYDESSFQQFPLETLMFWGGRKFRYARQAASGGPTIAVAAQSAAANHAHDNYGRAVPTSGVVGDTVVYVTGTVSMAATADYYKEGYFHTNNKGNGGGQCLRIKSHVALNTAATKAVTLYDPLVIALTAGTDTVGFRKNPYDGVLASLAAETGIFVGVPVISPTASYYYWIQTGGPCVVLANATIAVGANCVVGTSNGEIDPSIDNNSSNSIIGSAMTDGVADTNTLVYLTLD